MLKPFTGCVRPRNPIRAWSHCRAPHWGQGCSVAWSTGIKLGVSVDASSVAMGNTNLLWGRQGWLPFPICDSAWCAGRPAWLVRASPETLACRPAWDRFSSGGWRTGYPQSPSTAASRSAASPFVSPARAASPSLRSSAVCFSVAGCWRQGASASTSRATPRCRA